MCCQYYRFIEIHVKACKSNGIDCKIRGLSIIGRVKSDDDAAAADYAFLASDNEEISHCRVRRG